MEDLDLFKSEKLSRAVESLAEAVIITDPGGTITYVNPAFEKITGYSSEEALGKNPRILKSGQNPPEQYKDMWDVLLKGEVWRGQVINRRKDGSTYHAELTISPIWTPSGRVTSYVAVQHEVTFQIEAKKQLALRTEEYRILHGVAQILHETDQNMKDMLIRAMEALITFEELEVENKAGIFLADDNRRVLQLYCTIGDFSKEFLEKEKEIPYGNCLCGRVAESEEILVSNSCFTDERHENTFADMTAHGHYIVPLKSGETLVGVLFLYTSENPPWYERSQEILLSIGGLIADAIRHRRVEETLRQKNEELAQTSETFKDLSEVKNRFLGIASHDLRNPLYLIHGYSEVLMDETLGSLNEKQKHYLQKIFTASKQMRDLLRNLLDISRIESGKIELEKTQQDLNAVIQNQFELNRILANKKNITIHSNLKELPKVAFDKQAIIQVLDNFIGNAIKFSSSDTNIHIATEYVGNLIRCSVKDEGPGLSEEDQKKVFGEFETLSAKPTGGEQSTGLGLAIAKKLVLLHGGNVGVTSEPGKGAMFYFTLPVK